MKPHKEQIVDPGNTKAFAKMLKHFLINATARKRAKKWQDAKVSEYDVQTVGKQLLDIYIEALHKKNNVR